MSFFDLIFFVELELVAAPVQMAWRTTPAAVRTYGSQSVIDNGRTTRLQMYCIRLVRHHMLVGCGLRTIIILHSSFFSHPGVINL